MHLCFCADEDGSGHFLVDFQQKAYEAIVQKRNEKHKNEEEEEKRKQQEEEDRREEERQLKEEIPQTDNPQEEWYFLLLFHTYTVREGLTEGGLVFHIFIG